MSNEIADEIDINRWRISGRGRILVLGKIANTRKLDQRIS